MMACRVGVGGGRDAFADVSVANVPACTQECHALLKERKTWHSSRVLVVTLRTFHRPTLNLLERAEMIG